MEKMTIIEGLKRLKVIEKRMAKNAEDITRYASMVSTEKECFENQKKEVGSLVQANGDLGKEYLRLKLQIEKTNFSVTAEIGGETYTITELLTIRRKMAARNMATYKALNDSAGTDRLASTPAVQSGKPAYVVRFYDEKEKNQALLKWQELYDNIDARLEVLNAVTQLVD